MFVSISLYAFLSLSYTQNDAAPISHHGGRMRRGAAVVVHSLVGAREGRCRCRPAAAALRGLCVMWVRVGRVRSRIIRDSGSTPFRRIHRYPKHTHTHTQRKSNIHQLYTHLLPPPPPLRRRIRKLHPRPLVRAGVTHAQPPPVAQPPLLVLPEPQGQKEPEEGQGEA